MDVFEAIEKRHSYRGPFEKRPVPGEDLKRIVEAAIRAPSGRNEQTTSFVIVDDPGVLGRITEMGEDKEVILGARAFIACIVDKTPEAVYEGHSFQVEDCAAAVENMLLAITALGYATVWIDGWLRVKDRAGKIAKILELPGEKTVRVLLPLGIPTESRKQKEKKPFEERAWFNRYGEREASFND